MRAFAFACFVAAIIAIGAVGILDQFAQRTSLIAFTEPGVRP
jgi:hypothetical protein